MYWSLVARWELGLFHLFILCIASGAGGVLLWAIEGRVRHSVTRRSDESTLTPADWARLPVAIGLLAVGLLLWVPMRGTPVGGRFVFDHTGRLQQATVQGIVTTGGKVPIRLVMLRSFGPGGSTRGLLGAGYESQLRPMSTSPAFWREDTLFSTETLAVLATGDQVRHVVDALSGVESRLRHVDADQTAVFERRDGREVRVSPADVVALPAVVYGCFMDRTQQASVRVPDLIEPRGIPWAAGRPGCPRIDLGVQTQLLISDDAAFGDVHTVLTLSDSGVPRWQARLDDLTGGSDSSVLGAVPFEDLFTLIAADGADLVIVRIRWDGTLIDAERW